MPDAMRLYVDLCLVDGLLRRLLMLDALDANWQNWGQTAMPQAQGTLCKAELV